VWRPKKTVCIEEKKVPTDEVAVKIISMHDEKDKLDEDNGRLQKSGREHRNWKQLTQHPNCVFLYESFFGHNFSYMVMEKCEKGLFQALETMPDMTERGFGKIIAEMLLGIAHCHSCNVIHRDIKPDNFLVGRDNAVKLADFGFSTTISSQSKTTGVYGTAPFMCPEMLQGEPYDEKADVWSLAVVVYAFLFGCFPYTPTKEAQGALSASRAMKRAVRMGATPSFEPCARVGTPASGSMRSAEAMQLAKAVLNRDPVARPSAEEALRMPWMVASLNGHHLPDADLPSLRPMLYAAKKSGAFEMRDARKVTADDVLLNQLQAGKSKANQMDDVDMPVEKPIGGLRAMGVSKGASDSPRKTTAKVDWETASNRSTLSGSTNRSRGSEKWTRCASSSQFPSRGTSKDSML